MDSGDHHERRARFERYLLGTLDEHDRESVREAVIRDPDAYAELREIELDLLDAAADGTIDSARKKLVQERLAADARNHAAALVALALAERRARERHKPAWHWSIALPAAAVLVLATGLGLFLLRNASTADDRPGVSAGPGAGSGAGPVAGAGTPSSTTAATRAPDGALETAPRAEPRSPGEPDDPQGPPPAIAGSTTSSPGVTAGATPGGASGTAPNVTAALPDQARTIALFLPAGTLRGARPSVRVPASADTIRLELELEQPAPRHVDITLRAVREPSAAETPSALWTAARVAVRNDGGQSIATVSVPARVLPTGVVEVHVIAQSGAPSGTAEGTSAPLRAITFLVTRD